MLVESGDLIPVKRAAADIPWTKRKAVIFSQNLVHRGPVDFSVICLCVSCHKQLEFAAPLSFLG